MRYAYAHLDQRIYRHFPCVWVMALTIIHIVTHRVDLSKNPPITIRDLKDADEFARTEVYGERYHRAQLDYSIRDHLAVISSAIAIV